MKKAEADLFTEGFDIIGVIRALDYSPKENNSDYTLDVYIDQDRHPHVILDSKNLDVNQLNNLYSYIFGTGAMCMNRSRSYRKVLESFPEKTSFITVASVIQHFYFGPSDMKLMSVMTAWTDGMYNYPKQ